MLVGRNRNCCSPLGPFAPMPTLISISLNSCTRLERPHHLYPAAIEAAFDVVHLVERAPAVLSGPQVALLGVERHAETVANAICENASAGWRRPRRQRPRRCVDPNCSPDLWNGLSLGVLPSSLRRRMTPVRCALSGSGPPKSSSGTGPSRLFCVKPRRPLSPMMMYSLPSGPKRSTPPLWLPRSTGSVGSVYVVAIVLEGAQLDDVPVEGQRAAVPR